MSVYLDHAATTRPEEAVIDAMCRCMRTCAVNPSAAYAAAGEARRELRLARREVAKALGADPAGIVFTSGGTESNSWVFSAFAGRPVVLSATEHHSVLHAARAWRCAVTLVSPDDQGIIRPEAVERALRPDTALISVHWANNETGMLQPIEAIHALSQRRRIPLHTDAVAAFGHTSVDARHCELMTLSAHKLYGPQGVGCLYMAPETPLRPLLAGGGQEGGRRAGTENVPGIAGFRVAVELAQASLTQEQERLGQLMSLLLQRLRDGIPSMAVLGDPARRLPGLCAVHLPGLSSEQAIAALDLLGIQVSGGAACASRSREPSHVYRAMGLTETQAGQVLRLSLGRYSTPADMAEAADAIIGVWRRYHR